MYTYDLYSFRICEAAVDQLILDLYITHSENKHLGLDFFLLIDPTMSQYPRAWWLHDSQLHDRIVHHF